MNLTKILIVTSEFPPQPGGIGNHALNLALQLQKNGYKVGVIADVRSNDGLEEQQFDVTLPFEVFRIKRHSFSIITYLKRILIFNKLAKEHSILLASGKFPLWLVGLFPFKNKKLKLAVIHGSELNLSGIYKKLTNKALRNFDKVVAVSNFTKSLVNHLNLTNFSVIPNGFTIPGIYEEDIQKIAPEKKDPVLITVGTVSERKGQINVIRALPHLLKIFPEIHYHIVGIPSEQQIFEREALILGVLQYVTFHGTVTEERKYELLQESDVFIMLSQISSKKDVEGFGIAIIEANAMGLPSIGSRNCGIEDAISVNNSGLLVAPKDCEEICRSVELIWNNFSVYKKNAIVWSNQFRWEKIILKYLDVISK